LTRNKMRSMAFVTQRYDTKPAAKRRKPLAVVGNLS
jgi:hypothetical protein